MKVSSVKHDYVGFGFLGRVLGLVALTITLHFGGVSSSFAQNPSGRFDELRDHISGSDTMTVAELESWATTFAGEADTLGDRISDFLAASSVIVLYENEVGPLFTSSGQSSFANSWNGETNVGRGLARAMLGVYQAVFDAFDNDFVSQNGNFVDGLMFRSTENFPGSVPNPTDSLAIYEVQIDGTLNQEFGSDGGYNNNAARRMTGAYLSPGIIAEVIVPDELVNAGFQIRVGGHSWDLRIKNNANRLHRVSNVFDITSNVVRIANPMGGNIYIEVPVGAGAGIVDVQFRNTIRAPFFSNRSFEKTTQAEWENVERSHPGAFTDIESEHSLWTVPSKWVDDLSYDDLMEIIEAHDANIQVASEYVGKNANRHKAILYMIVDTQIRALNFSIGYPQSNYGSFSQNSIRAPLTLQHATDPVLWHEHGHAELMTMFPGETESWNHMLAVAIYMENYGMTAQEAFSMSLAFGSQNHTTSDAMKSWVVMDEFINNSGMAFQQGSFRPRGHADYVEYIEMFGLEAIQNFNRRINFEMDGLDWNVDWPYGRTNHNRNNRILRLSRAAGVNVAPLFHLWGHRPSNFDSLMDAMEAEGLGESVQIYDRMIEARDTVPMSQAEWNAVDNVMEDFLNELRGPWQELRTNYDLDRAQDAVDQIQALIDMYFPNGRPADVGGGVPIATTVTVFSEPNFTGIQLELSEGIFQVADLNAGPIGNDNISSILVPAGYEVRVAQHGNNSGIRATYTSSQADLGSLDNNISWIQVISNLEDQEPIGETNSISLDENWRTVTLSRNYNDPVVITGPPSYNETDPATVRVRNVTSNSFEMQIDNWDYLAPVHRSEVVSYMVLESGQYTLANGTTIVAGNRDGQTHEAQTYDLETAFNGLSTPLVFANVVTQNDAQAVTTRVRVNSASEFEIILQEEEANDGIHAAETISYFAVEPGAGATGGLHFDAGDFVADQTGQFTAFDTGVSLNAVSSFFAGMQTRNGIDTTALRNTVLSSVGANVFTEEERSSDNEITHADETIGFFVINPGLIMATMSENVLLGDANLDGVIDFSDISPFITALLGGQYLNEADINQDGNLDFDDIGPFIGIVLAE